MKPILTALTLLCIVTGAGCSRSEDTAAAKPTPVPNLKADANRLQQAINKAAEQRKKQSGEASPTPAAP